MPSSERFLRIRPSGGPTGRTLRANHRLGYGEPPPLDVQRRHVTMATAAWLSDGDPRPDPQIIRGFFEAIEAACGGGMPTPYIYRTATPGLVAEWPLEGLEVSLDSQVDGTLYAHATFLEAGRFEEACLDAGPGVGDRLVSWVDGLVAELG